MLVVKDITELVSLRGLVPICMCCRKVRDDTSYWRSVEEYCEQQMDLDFTHSICPDCLDQFYPDENQDARGATNGL